MSDYTENKTPNLIINTLEDPSKLSEITVGENEIVLVPDETEEEIAKKQDKLVAGTNITLVDDPLTQTTLISSTAQESFFRGRWGNWSLAPSNGNEYPEDYHGNRKPTDNDFMVLSDASDYVNPSSLTHPFTVINTHSTAQFTINFIDEYSVEHTYYYAPYQSDWVQINEHYSLRYVSGAPGRWYIRTNKPEDTHIVVNGIEYEVDPTGTTVSAGVLICQTDYSTTPISGGLPSQVGQYQGAWRFVYHGDWDTNGKLGWTPQYQIENTLPIATDTEPGIAKLYNTTGQNIDGSMTQKAISDAIDNINESYFRGKWSNWTSVPIDTSRYPEDYNHNRIPTENDYMVVTDASDYTAEGMEIKIYWDGWETHQFSVNDSALVRMNGVSTWTPFNLENDVIIYIKDFEPSYGHFGIKCNVDMLVNGSIVPAGNVVEFIESRDPRTVYYYVAGGSTLSGTWRFAYHGVWSSIGKNGWLPEYQLEDVLPIATDTEPGITKLYTTTGSNTDGTMDQKSITTELNAKQDVLTAGNNITIDANNRIDAADKTLVSFVIWEDEE